MDRVLEIEALREAVLPFDLGLVVLFGSRAGAKHRADSDVDFGVLHRSGRRLSHRELGALHLALSRLSGIHADVVDLSTFDAIFRYEIVLHGRPVFEAEPWIWTGFVARALIDHDDLGPSARACIAAVGRAAREAVGP
jgi:predicted nucleotidyltransferase